MDKCCGCRKLIWPWQKTGMNTSWHRHCSDAWSRGYETAKGFAELECLAAGTKSPWEIYSEWWEEEYISRKKSAELFQCEGKEIHPA